MVDSCKKSKKNIDGRLILGEVGLCLEHAKKSWLNL